MRQLLPAIINILFLFLSTSTLAKDVYVEGYYRDDGTYVQGHYRTAPNNTINDNFSTEGNVNRYTGKHGWIPKEHYSRSHYGYISDDKIPVAASIQSYQAPPETQQVSINNSIGNTFEDLDGWFVVVMILLGIGVVNLCIIEPYRHVKEFCASPRLYHSKYGTSEVITNVVRGVLIIIFWLIIIAFILSNLGFPI